MFRVGFGFDVHPLVEGKDFYLGGIKIDSSFGAMGHSDADVLIHAICDAILGAAALGDIGTHFPDSDMKYKGIDSKLLLKEVMNLLAKNNYRLVNIDSTLALEAPKISPYIDKMRQKLAEVMSVETGAISIKATTNEKMGFVGRKEGVCAYAVALIEKTN